MQRPGVDPQCGGDHQSGTHHLHLTLPPPMGGGDRQNQHSSHMDGQLASTQNLPALYISSLLYPNKPVNTEPLSVTVLVVIGTGTVLVGTVSYTRTATILYFNNMHCECWRRGWLRKENIRFWEISWYHLLKKRWFHNTLNMINFWQWSCTVLSGPGKNFGLFDKKDQQLRNNFN